MEIPVKDVLIKMQQESQRALLVQDESKIREHLLIIQTLCSLVLEQQTKSWDSTLTRQVMPEFILNEPKQKLDEEEANEDSLFDF
ncbi:YwdI family protein [Bacillus sp. DJP31]|uniref:YwdI family protein n=1 Tax=Bacillus sp. DJP31 TaxID=3409789 RepID=UPI003BB547ED